MVNPWRERCPSLLVKMPGYHPRSHAAPPYLNISLASLEDSKDSLAPIKPILATLASCSSLFPSLFCVGLFYFPFLPFVELIFRYFGSNTWGLCSGGGWIAWDLEISVPRGKVERIYSFREETPAPNFRIFTSPSFLSCSRLAASRIQRQFTSVHDR